MAEIPSWILNKDSDSMQPIPSDAEVENLAASQESALQDSLARQSVNDPYSVTPSMVVPSPEQAQMEAQAQQGSYPTFQAGGPEDVQSMIQKNSALAQLPQVPNTETIAANAGQFVDPRAPASALPAVPGVEDQAIAGLNKAYGLQQRGIEAAADAGAKKSVEDAAYREQYDKQIQAQQLQNQQHMAEINKSVDLQMKDLDTLKSQMADNKFVDEKVDPEHFWNSKSSGQKVLAGIAIALGGIGGAYTGKGGNVAMDIINKAIDNDIDAQKFNITQASNTRKEKMANQQGQVSVTNSLLSGLNSKFNNQMQADQAARYLMLEQAKNKVESIASKYAAPELKAKAQVLTGQLQEEQTKSMYAFKAAAEQKATQKQLFASMEQGGMKSLNTAQISSLPKELQERYVPGYGFANSKESVAQFQKVRAENEPALQGLGEVMKMAQDVKGMGQLSPSKRAVLETKLTILAGQLRLPVTGPGSMQQAEYERLRTALGDPAKILSLNSVELKKLQVIQSFLQGNISQGAAQYGLEAPKQIDYTKVGFTPTK